MQLLIWNAECPSGAIAQSFSFNTGAENGETDVCFSDFPCRNVLFAHLKRILRLDRLGLRGPRGARDEFLLAATAQNLRKLAKLIPQVPPIPA